MQQTAQKIDQLQVTRDTLTSRGGLTFLVKYVEAIGILTLLLNRFAKIKKSVKGVSVGNLFLQALYFFFDGTRRHLCHFDELQRDQGYRAVVEMPEEQTDGRPSGMTVNHGGEGTVNTARLLRSEAGSPATACARAW